MCPARRLDAVTGAFGYSGAVIAGQLLAAGHRVRTLTSHPERAPAGTPIEAYPLDFTDPAGLERALRGVHTLYNNYWVRFAHGPLSHEIAVANSRVLFDAAVRAGVQRIVHVSITHASPDSRYPYFRGKGEVERYLAGTGIPAAIARPAVLFGGNGVLVNNIAWLLRRLPVFAIGGDGRYRVRGIHTEDLARLCVELGAGDGRVTVDAVGPQSLTFRELVLAIRDAVGSGTRLVSVPGPAIPPMATMLGLVLRDVLLTAEEYRAMADGLADSGELATGQIAFTEWVSEHGPELGRRYLNELDLHFRPSRRARGA